MHRTLLGGASPYAHLVSRHGIPVRASRSDLSATTIWGLCMYHNDAIIFLGPFGGDWISPFKLQATSGDGKLEARSSGKPPGELSLDHMPSVGLH